MKFVFQYIFLVLGNFSRRCWRSQSGESQYFLLIVGAVFGILYIAMPGMFHDFFNYILDFVFDALHSSFGDDPDSPFGSGQRGDADNPLRDGITLPGDDKKPSKN